MPEKLQLQLLPQGKKSLSKRTQLHIDKTSCLMQCIVALLSWVRDQTLSNI